MAVYAGFPAALNGLFAAKEVFKEREDKDNGLTSQLSATSWFFLPIEIQQYQWSSYFNDHQYN